MTTPPNDYWTVRAVVVALALVALATVVGTIVLATQGVDVPEALQLLGASAVGALAALLASTRTTP